MRVIKELGYWILLATPLGIGKTEIYTLVKIGTELCQMTRKRYEKYKYMFWHRSGQVKMRNQGNRPVDYDFQNLGPPATPPGYGVYKGHLCQTDSEWFIPFSLLVSVSLLLLNCPFCYIAMYF